LPHQPNIPLKSCFAQFNGIALFMVEKFHQKTEAVERKIVKSLDSISEVCGCRLLSSLAFCNKNIPLAGRSAQTLQN
jgi:hypothetical protein